MRTTDEQRTVLAAAYVVAVEHGLVLDAGRMFDHNGVEWTPGQYQAAISAQTVTPPQGPPTGRQARRLLDRLHRARANLGRQLLAAADTAYAEALRHAGVKLSTRARSRSSAGKQAEVTQAIETGQPLAPFMQQVGIHESDLLAGAFDVYRTQARDAFDTWHDRQFDIVERAGLDPAIVKVGDVDAAVDFLADSLLALTRQTLVEGTVAPSMLAAPLPRRVVKTPNAVRALAERDRPAPRRVIPSTPRAVEALQREGRGVSEVAPRVKPTVPAILRTQHARSNPHVPARMITDSIRVADKRARAIPAESPDLVPTVGLNDGVATVEEEVAAQVGDGGGRYQWVHGFYGEPIRPFDPHEALDGFETTDTEADPELLNGEGWPDGDYYQPQDHDYCTCEWVPV